MSVPNKFGFRLRPGSQRELTALQPSLKRLDLNDSAPCRAASEIPWQRGFKTCVNARACFGSLSIPVNGQCQPPLLFRIAARGKNTRKFAKHLNSYLTMKTEFEVFSPPFDEILEPVVCGTREEADKVVTWLREASSRNFGTSCNWQVREVEVGKRPIPPKAEVVTPVLVDEVRKLMAKHGQDVIVTFAWNGHDGVVNIATAGTNRQHSEWAYELSEKLAKYVGLNPGGTLYEDRREEHQV